MRSIPTFPSGAAGIATAVQGLAMPTLGVAGAPTALPQDVPPSTTTQGDTPPPSGVTGSDPIIDRIFEGFRSPGLVASPGKNLFSSGELLRSAMNRFGPSADIDSPFASPEGGFSANLPRVDLMGMKQNMQFGNSMGSMGGNLGGPIGGMAGATKYANLDAHNAELNAVAQRMGVPANLLKVMINRESSGDWEGSQRTPDIGRAPGAGDEIHPFVGILRDTAEAWGYDFDAMYGNKEMQLEAMAYGIKLLAQEYGGWDNAIKVYFGGEQALQPGGFTDELGMHSDTYYNSAKSLWEEFDTSSGFDGDYEGTWGGDWQNIFGAGAKLSDWGEFGKVSTLPYYKYGDQYGLSGYQHTGLDIEGTFNAPYTAPVSGTITCAGTNNGPGADGGGCSAFATMRGNGAGRIEMQLDDGTVLIFGHSQGSNVQVGQRVNAGDVLGTIGWANSNHIHLEARVRDASTSSGWRIVDPRTVLGGAMGGGGSQYDSSKPAWWNILKYG